MLATTGDTVSWGLSAFGAAGALGAIYAYFAGSKSKGLIELYKGEADAQKLRGDRLEREVGDVKQRLSSVEGANHVLAQTISGTEAIHTLQEELKEQHREMMLLMTSFLHRQAEIFEKGR